MKNILLALIMVFSSCLIAQKHRVEILVNPSTSLSSDGGYNFALEYQVAKDFGLELGIIKSSRSYTFSSEFKPTSWNKVALQGNCYFRHSKGLDRWFITGMIIMESHFGDFDFSALQFLSGATGKNIIKGYAQRYYLGLGIGYKLVLSNRVPIKLSISQLKVFANHYSDSLKEEVSNLNKKSFYTSGLKIAFTFGFRFYLKKAPKIISE